MTHKSTVLIVDDTPSARDMMVAILFQEGYDLACARSGPEALAMAAELTPDVILLDVMMPSMDGFEVCQRLRANPVLAEVPIIMVTALDDRDSRLRGIEAGADDFISKPFDADELQMRVRTTTKLNRYRHLLLERAKFERLVELSPDGLLIVDARGAIYLANPAMLHMLGAQKENDVVGKSAFTFIAPEQTDYFSTYLHDAIAGLPQTSQIEAWSVRLNGERFPIAVNAGAFTWNEEPVAQIIVRDITKHKQAEELLREERSFVSAILDTTSALVIVLDPQGRIVRFNRACEETTGYSFEQARDRHFWELLRPPEDESIKATFEKLGAEQFPSKYETNWAMNDGSNRLIVWSNTAIFDNDGFVRHIICTGTDITERKQAEDALQRYANEQVLLYTVASAAATLLNPDELLSAILDAVLPALNTDVGWVTLPESTPDESSRIIAWRGVPESFPKTWQAIAPCACPLYAFPPDGKNAQTETLIIECPHLPDKALIGVELRSHVCIPLRAGDRVLSVLNVAWREPRSYSEADRALLLTIGQQVGPALDNAQLYQAARQVDRLQVLDELDQALATTLDPEKVTEITLQQVAAALDTPRGALFVLPSQSDTSSKQTPIWGQRGFTLEQGWIETTLSAQDVRRLHTILQQLQDSREAVSLSANELAAISRQHNLAEQWTHGGLIAPIWGDDGLMAILALGGRPANRPLTDEDRALVQAAASRAGQAIQNARLYQASQQQSARLSTLYAISTAAVSSLELDIVFRQVLELTLQALNAASGSILVSETDTGKIMFVLTLPDESTPLHSHYLSPGQGIAGWVVQHGQPVCVNEARRDPRWYNGMDAITGRETQSLLCAPLKHHGAITGAIEIVNKHAGTFTNEDLSLLEAVASIAATALENARLYTSTRARAAELTQLNEVGLALTSTLDFSTVVHAALSQIQRLFQAEIVSLLQPDPQTGELCFVKTLVKRTPVEIPVRLQPGESIVGWALEQRQPVLIDDVQTDPRALEWVHEHMDIQARGLMAVPLLARDRDIGVIEIASSEPGAYTNSELRTLQAIASTLTIALENASLYDELRKLLHEREHAQTQLIHAEKMTALGRLVASIAHEINNPLQAVQTYLTLSQEELGGGRRIEKVNRYLNTVGDEIDRIAIIVRRMRDFYRPAREELQPTYLHAVLESVLELTNKQLQHSRVTVERVWANYLPEIQANPDHLKQVFLNLVLNGIDAMTTGGTLRISTDLDQISINNKQKVLAAVRVEFSDTGEGMPPEISSRIFEPFFTTKERGSGLGLSISYGLIQSHNGKITVESHVGLGTTFTIILPVEQSFNN